MRSIGIFGGNFDPIHLGHLRLAQEALATFNLNEIRFIPSGRPPHRDRALVSDQHRVAMLERALANNSLFKIDTRELGNPEPTYTFNTLQSLRGELGNAVSLALLIGADQFQLFHTWHRWAEIFDLAHLIVAQRPGSTASIDGLLQPVSQAIRPRICQQAKMLSATPAGQVFTFEMTPLAISSSAIRVALKAKITPRYLLPDAVLDYIHDHHLYA